MRQIVGTRPHVATLLYADLFEALFTAETLPVGRVTAPIAP